MKILMLTGGYLTTSVGGTEVFVHSLSRELLIRGVDAQVAFHGEREQETNYDGVALHVLPPLPAARRDVTYGLRSGQAPGYRGLLEKLRPDVVHAHAWSDRITLDHFEITKAADIPLVVTHHVPGMTCLNRALLYLGRTPCDGEIRIDRCTRCRARVFGGAPPPLDALFAHLPLDRLERLVPASLRRVFGARADVRRFQAAVHSCIAAADVIHALNDWGRDVFLRNGAPPDRVMRIRTGLPMREGPGNGAASAVPAWLTRDQNARTLRVIYWGRLAWEKGIDVLIAAVRRLPTVPMEVLILGSGAPAFEARLLRLAGGDPRIRFAPPVAPSEVVGVLRQADVGVIPSLWLETGPLTVLEAQAAGLPVIGSRLGGIAELCPEGVGARLFPPGDATALALILDELAGSADALQRLRATVPRPRSMKEVAAELLPVYRRLTESRRNTGQVVGT